MYLGRRIIETLVSHLIVSIPVAALFYFGILDPAYKLSVFMLGATALFDILAVMFFSSIYFKYTEEDNQMFYATNMFALSFLIIPAVLLALLDGVMNLEPVYTFFFFPFKLCMIAFGMSKVVSALIFGLVLMAVAIIVPLFLRKVLPEEELMPPMLELEENSEENNEEKKVSE